MSPILHRSVRDRQLPGLQRRQAAHLAQERAQAEAGARAAQRQRDEVEKEMLATLAAQESFEALSPGEKRLRNLELEQQARRPIDPKDIRKYPDGWMMARAEVLARWEREAQQEREKQERKAGIPQAQARWDRERQEINAARDQAISEAQERCRTDETAARETAANELAGLGERPTYEVKT